MASNYGMHFFEASALTGDNVNIAIMCLASLVKKMKEENLEREKG